MSLELVVDARSSGIWLGLLRDGKLIELHEERGNSDFAVGDIYLGRVRRIAPSLNAAFVDVGYEKDAFLHYTDLSPYFKSLVKFTEMAMNDKSTPLADFSKFNLEPEIVKTGKIAEVAVGKPNVLVQILKEPISSKGPRISCELSLPGRFIVVTPFNNFVNVSRKIHSTEERKRLQRIIESMRARTTSI